MKEESSMDLFSNAKKNKKREERKLFFLPQNLYDIERTKNG